MCSSDLVGWLNIERVTQLTRSDAWIVSNQRKYREVHRAQIKNGHIDVELLDDGQRGSAGVVAEQTL